MFSWLKLSCLSACHCSCDVWRPSCTGKVSCSKACLGALLKTNLSLLTDPSN